MADLVAQLRAAVEADDAAAVEAALAAGANPNSSLDGSGRTALHGACSRGRLACVRALLAAGATPNAATWALLDVAPELALVKDKQGELPLQVALIDGFIATARCLLEHGTLPPPAEVLALLEAAWWRQPEAVLPLYAPLVARQPLTPAEWACVPTPCPGLGTLLPAVLARSEAEAALLMAHLPAADRKRLRTAALCIKRVERRRRLSLPVELLRPLLLAAVE